MEKLKKIARALDVVLRVVFWVCIACAGLFLLLCVLFFFVEEGSFSTGLVLPLGALEVKFLPDYVFFPDTTLLWVGLSLHLPANLLVVCLGVRLLRGILLPMKNGLPFHGVVAKNLRSLSWLSLIGGGISCLLDALLSAVLYSALDVRSLFAPNTISGYSVNLQLDLNFLLVFAVFYLLSLVFQYGEELQRQSDETL